MLVGCNRDRLAACGIGEAENCREAGIEIDIEHRKQIGQNTKTPLAAGEKEVELGLGLALAKILRRCNLNVVNGRIGLEPADKAAVRAHVSSAGIAPGLRCRRDRVHQAQWLRPIRRFVQLGGIEAL